MVVGLSTLFTTYGKLFKSRRTFETSSEDRPTMTAMIPALDEERTIAYALASLSMQTVPPDKVIVVDDGSTDRTPEIVDELSSELEIDIERRRHDVPMGKTVGMKEVARDVETDTLFNLDADTFLESEDYLERLLEPHHEADVASSFGTVYPTERSSKQEFYEDQIVEMLPEDSLALEHILEDLEIENSHTGVVGYFKRNRPIIQYRNVDFHVQQRFFADGIMRGFGSMLYPVGSAVLYDREKLVSVFDDYEESLGDDLTNSEDLFVGFAFCDRGWSNIQIPDTYTRSALPGLRKTFKQNYLWGSGYLQSAYYFKHLTFRYRKKRISTDGGTDSDLASLEYTDPDSATQMQTEQSASDRATTQRTKQPMGRIITSQLIDGFYPTAALLMTGLSFIGLIAIELIVLFILLEFVMTVVATGVTKTRRLDLGRNLIPFVVLRAIMLPVLTYTYLRVGTDIMLGNRDWRK